MKKDIHDLDNIQDDIPGSYLVDTFYTIRVDYGEY